MKKYELIMIIDDDPVNNFIVHQSIRVLDKKTKILEFTDAQTVINFIRIHSLSLEKVLLFLDLNLPVTNGWEFLDFFTSQPDDVKNKFTVYILSSSINTNDKQKAAMNPGVKKYLVKPLTIAELKSILK